MSEVSQQDIDEGVAALDQLRERIIPKYFQTPIEVFEELIEKYKDEDATHIRQTLFWNETEARLELVNVAVDAEGNALGHGENNSHPCPPCCPLC